MVTRNQSLNELRGRSRTRIVSYEHPKDKNLSLMENLDSDSMENPCFDMKAQENGNQRKMLRLLVITVERVQEGVKDFIDPFFVSARDTHPEPAINL